jgi:molybdopterin-guanine dinucleotide biosynthesis protein A
LARGGVNAVVLAGGPADDISALEPGAPNKAFIRIAGMTLVERTLRGVRSSSRIDRIVVVAPPAAHGHDGLALADECCADGERIGDSLRSGLSHFPPDDLVLVAASDLPILSAEAVDDFCAQALSLDPDIAYGCVERTVHLASYPLVPHTWARLREGTYCGAGLIAMKPRAVPELQRFIERLGAARKNPLQLASIFGWDVLLRFALRRLSMQSAERRASQILRLRACAIVTPYAEAAVNVDRVSDVELANQLAREGGLVGGPPAAE